MRENGKEKDIHLYRYRLWVGIQNEIILKKMVDLFKISNAYIPEARHRYHSKRVYIE